MEIIQIEAVLMPNNEVIHFGKTLGFITDKQRKLINAGAQKLTRGNETVICLKGSKNFNGDEIEVA